MEVDDQVEDLKSTIIQPFGATCVKLLFTCMSVQAQAVCVSLFCSSCVSFSFSPARESLLTTVLTHSLHFLLSKTAKALSHCLVQLLFLPI